MVSPCLSSCGLSTNRFSILLNRWTMYNPPSPPPPPTFHRGNSHRMSSDRNSFSPCLNLVFSVPFQIYFTTTSRPGHDNPSATYVAKRTLPRVLAKYFLRHRPTFHNLPSFRGEKPPASSQRNPFVFPSPPFGIVRPNLQAEPGWADLENFFFFWTVYLLCLT